MEEAPFRSVLGPCRLLAIHPAEVRDCDWASLQTLSGLWTPPR